MTMLSRSRLLVLACVAAAIAAGVGIAAGLGGFGGNTRNPATSMADYVRPHVPPGVVLRQSARVMEQRVRRSLGPHSVITSVVVVRHRREIRRVVGGTGPVIEHGGPAWIVRACGLFRPETIPPGGHFRVAQRSGYVIIDDRTSNNIAYRIHSRPP